MPESAAAFIAGQIERIRRFPAKKIVFPEGDDSRVLEAARHLAAEKLVEPFLIGKPPANAPAGVAFIDPLSSPHLEKYAAMYHERRKAKGVLRMEAAEVAARRLQFAALMVSAGDADAMVGSAVHTTAETVRAVLQCIDLQPGIRKLSAVHIMAVQDRGQGHQGLLGFADCAILANPTAVELAGIAISAAGTVRAVLNTEPLVAMLSFSTKGSAKHPDVDKVVEAVRYVRARAPELEIDGELQADAALSEFVGQKKSPGSRVAGHANVLIFPDLDSANIGYKLVERLGGGALLAVLCLGVSKPANILSRGCSAEDIVNAALIAAVQAEGRRAVSS